MFVGELMSRLQASHMDLRTEDMDTAIRLGRLMYDELLAAQVREINLVPPRTAAEYAIQHPVQVAVVALVIGRGLRQPESVLHRAAASALLMDIGEVWLPEELYAKAANLTTDEDADSADLSDEERSKVREHPIRALAMMRAAGQFDRVLATVVLQHHERWDGSGYPRGLDGEEINVGARVVAVADTYDALLQERPYHDPMPPNMAMEYIMAFAGELFDSDVGDAFVNTIPSFPPGMLVRLENGDQGVVVKANLGLPGRPSVRVHYTNEGQRVRRPILVDLSHPENQVRSVAAPLDDWEVAT